MIEFKKIEEKWQKKWEKSKIFEVKENPKKKKYAVIEMFPYPSSASLHMGHAFNYTIGDIYARFKRMQGFNVLYPMGYDSLGLPAENAAIKEGINPKKYTEDSIKKFIKQQKNLGLSYDWSRMFATHESNYYKWDQWIFLKMLEKGIAFRKKAAVNFCSKCNTVLANEQVHDGKCWRHEDTDVEIKQLEQWFFKITDYAGELYDDIEKLKEWPEDVKAMQKNWIGKSYGTEIEFKIAHGDYPEENIGNWKIFTTRPDTIYGVTFMVVSSQHPELMRLVTDEQEKEVEEFFKKIKSTSEKDVLDKEGVFTGSYAVNPLTNEKIPVYAGNFVVADYGSGMVMAVPAHDQRDFEFAKKYRISMKKVIAPNFILSGKDAPRKDVGTLERRTVTAIIEHFSENKFLLLKEPSNYVLVGGGVEKDETPEEAIRREIKEETGYLNFEIKKVLMDNLFAFGFRHTKDKNQKTNDIVFYIKLKDDKKIKSEAESDKYGVLWLDKKDVLNKISWEHHRFMWNLFSEGESAYIHEGILVNSDKFNGLKSDEARNKISEYLEKNKLGKRIIQYKLRDWLISRQRYWGTPIPVIYCDKCGIVPVPEKELPVKLPEKVEFGKGNPLETNKEFVNVKCPKCNGKARRETDTMDTFVNSSWYFLRYCDSKNKKEIFDKKKTKYWMPIDMYIGGKEHACMHLIYFRFYTKFLRDLGLLDIDEPTYRLFNQGMLHGNDGYVMSKSRGNVVDPLSIIDKYGADTLRFYLVSVASPDKDFSWSDEAIDGSFRFINRIIDYFDKVKIGKTNKKTESKFNKTIKDITEDIEKLRYNLAVIKIRELFACFNEKESKDVLEGFLKLLSVFCPHISEELWSKLGNKTFISLEKWPKFDEKKIDKKFEEQEKQIEKTINDIRNIFNIIGKEAKKVFLYAIPKEVEIYKEIKDEIEKALNVKLGIYAVNDAKKYDPENKASKTKMGKPAIYVE